MAQVRNDKEGGGGGGKREEKEGGGRRRNSQWFFGAGRGGKQSKGEGRIYNIIARVESKRPFWFEGGSRTLA